jgi:hypothetical protein
LPLVPVMATNGASGACARRSRQNSSMSPITSTAARAQPDRPVRRRMGQRHAGRQHQRGDPRPVDVRRSAVGIPALVSPWRACRRLSSQTDDDSAPPASSALGSASPEPPGRTRRLVTGKRVTGIISAASASKAPASASTTEIDPEADHDLRLGPAAAARSGWWIGAS